MLTINASNVASFDTPTLLAFYNANSGVNSIKRFSDRKNAEKRVLALVDFLASKENPANVEAFVENRVAELNAVGAKGFEGENEFDAAFKAVEFANNPPVNSAGFLFPKAADFIDAVTPVNNFVPAGFSSIFNKSESTALVIVNPITPVTEDSTAFNLESGEFIEPVIYSVVFAEINGVNITAYEGESESDAKAAYEKALVNPLSDKSGVLGFYINNVESYSDNLDSAEVETEETEEEEAARIKAESDAENAPVEASKAAPKGRSSNSLGVALSWQNPDVAKARLIRDGVTVTFEGNTSAYRSTREAFRAFRLPDSVHIRFRLKLKASRKETFEYKGNSYIFEII